MTQKDVFLRAFKINTANPSKNVDLVSRLAQALNNSNSANDRRLNLNTNSEKEDLISSFKIEKQKIYCTMIRANIGNGVRSIAEDLLKQKTFQLSQLSKNELDSIHPRFQLLSRYLRQSAYYQSPAPPHDFLNPSLFELVRVQL